MDTENRISMPGKGRVQGRGRMVEQDFPRDLLHNVVSALSDGILVQKADGRVSVCNGAAERILGRSREQMAGHMWFDSRWQLIGEHGEPFPFDALPPQVALRTGKSCEGLVLGLKKPNHAITWLRVSAQPLWRNDDSEPYAVLCWFRDISVSRHEEAERQRLAAIVESSCDAIVGIDHDRNITSWNVGAEKLYGYTATEAIGRPLSIFVPNARAKETERELARLWRGERVEPFETIRERENGKPVPVSVSLSPVRDINGRLTGAFSIERDISEQKWCEAQLQYDAFHDALTGLPNRSLFIERLEHAIERLEGYGVPYAVLIVDLDNFKVVNDSLGHKVGDQLLVQFAQRILACLRPMDTLARFAGDEFCILLEDAGREVAHRVAQAMQEALRESFRLDGYEIYSGVSIGVALGDTGYKSTEEILRDADTALYRAKHRGKACHVVFDRPMREEAISRLRLETELRRAVASRRLAVHYQPIVDLSTGTVVGCEALARWFHPQYGEVEPSVFVPVAEESGLICHLGELVLETAVRDVAKWLKNSRVTRDFYVSVNLSTKQFSHPKLPDEILSIIDRHGLRGANLRLEITETILIKNDRTVVDILDRLRTRGIQICMDDFGTGYSSLCYLHRFPIDVLKVDQSFIQELTRQNKSRAIVRSIMELADSLQMETIAEGAESVEHVEALKNMGFSRAQGFLFHQAKDREAMEALIGSFENSYKTI